MTTLDSAGTDQDLWQVEITPGDVRTVTLDQLDEAFQNGYVTEQTRIWQEGMPCAVALGDLLGAGNDEPEAQSETPAPYAQRYEAQAQYEAPLRYEAQQQYAYATPQAAAQPHYAAPPSAPPQRTAQSYYDPYGGPSRAPAPQAVQVPARSAPPPARAVESAWPPVVAVSSAPPSRSSGAVPSSTPVPPSMAPIAMDIPEYDYPYAGRSSRKGKWLLAAIVLGAGGFAAFQVNAHGLPDFSSSTPAVQAAVIPPAPQPPVSHAFDPGPPVKLGESKPPLEITTRDTSKPADSKTSTDTAPQKLSDTAKKVLASGKKPAPVAHSRHSAPAGKSGGSSGFKLGKSGSKYDPLNGSL